MNGIKIGGVIMNSSRCPSMKSELHKDISTILTMNSLAGWDMAWLPKPRPYHFPDHHAILVSSCLNSLDRKTAIKNFWTARCIAMIVMRPKTACDASHSSRNH